MSSKLTTNTDTTMSNDFPSIVCSDEVLAGSPRIDGRRLAVGDVISLVSIYGTLQEVRQDYELSGDEIKQALLYCSTLQCKEDKPDKFCHNCRLRSQSEVNIDLSDSEEIYINGEAVVKSSDSIYFGTLQEYMEHHQGKEWWKIACDLLIDFKGKFD
jgi:uncharacterized protein (DUF433 family)